MTETAVTPPTKTAILPEILPIFPLSGVLLLPGGRLPLNIFEPRYLAMIDDAMGQGRLIGVIQPSIDDEKLENPPLYNVGCVGRIASFTETDDGRYLIGLQGLCRFQVAEELPGRRGYRIVRPEWQNYLGDLGPAESPDYDRARLTNVLRTYFKAYGVAADWNVVQNTASEALVSSLAMICPLQPNEKQALLESPSLKARAELLITLLEMACLNQSEGDGAKH